MRTIIRCPNCFTYVYDDARTCHGCGDRIGRRKILRRGSWIFIGLAVSGFAIGRGIDLQQDRRQRVRQEFEEAARSQAVRAFLRSWLLADNVSAGSLLSSSACGDEMAKLRDLYPDALPATDVDSIELLSDRTQTHSQRNKGKVSHPRPYSETETKAKAKARRTVCSEPTHTPSSSFKNRVDGKVVVDRVWSLNAVEFEAIFRKDGVRYTLYGRACVDSEYKISCLFLDHLDGVEGSIPAKE